MEAYNNQKRCNPHQIGQAVLCPLVITVIYQKVSRDEAILTYKDIFVCQAVEIGGYRSDLQASIADTARPIPSHGEREIKGKNPASSPTFS